MRFLISSLPTVYQSYLLECGSVHGAARKARSPRQVLTLLTSSGRDMPSSTAHKVPGLPLFLSTEPIVSRGGCSSHGSRC